MSYGQGWKPEYVAKVERLAAEIVESAEAAWISPRNSKYHVALKACEWGLLQMDGKGYFFGPAGVPA